jgi:hypothetical protein
MLGYIIKKQALSFNLKINDNIKIDLSKLYKTNNDYINECSVIAKNKGGKILSKYCLNSYDKIKLQCKNGHIWEAKINNIKNGTWCKKCYLIKRGILKETEN